LENSRIQTVGAPTVAELSDHQRAASHLLVDGAFNINSTSVEAWKALLASFLGVTVNSLDGAVFQDDAASPIVRTAYPLTTAVASGVAANTPSAFTGFRSLDATEIDALAHSIVEQVKTRGPFVSLADFVNRSPRPVSLQAGAVTGAAAKPWQLSGALQAAIEKSGINSGFYGIDDVSGTRLSVDAGEGTDIYKDTISTIFYYREYNRDAMEISLATNAPGFLSQADLLARFGGCIQARSDTFKVRCYGDVKDELTDEVIAKAWGEAVVQRLPEKVNGTDAVLGDPVAGTSFGRRFRIVDFRWLSEDEI
jgi:hypothetical protein